LDVIVLHWTIWEQKSLEIYVFKALKSFIGLDRFILWWSWRELNPRPKLLYLQYYTFSLVFNFT